MRKSAFNKLICLLIAAVFAVAYLSHTLWITFSSASTSSTLSVNIGEHDGEYSNNPIENIPGFVPQHILDTLTALSQTKSPAVMGALIDAVTNIYGYHSFESDVHLAATADELFGGGALSISSGDYVIYTVGEGDNIEIVLLHVGGSSGTIHSAAELENAIQHSWTGIDVINSMWLRGTLYTSFNAPLEFDGELYYNQNDGDRYTPPPQAVRGTWFHITRDLQYTSFNNVYPSGHIVRYGTNYYIARGAAWDALPTVTWAWSDVFEFGGYATQGETVFVGSGSTIRFFTALRNTSAAPSEQSARNGDWREIKNAWIGRRGDFITKNYYFEHNTYSTGDVVVFGVAANMRYRYYRAIRAVSADEPPVVPDENDHGKLVLNSDYWEIWS